MKTPKSKNCKVITTYFGKRLSYPYNVEDTISIISDSIKNEINLNPGVDNLDVIIVNHNCGVKKGNDYLNTLNGLKTYCGTVKVIHRPWDDGEGVSLKSMNYAFNMFKNVYHYWFFQEDDYKVKQENYYSKGIKMLKGDIAFIGYDTKTWTKLKENKDKIKLKLKLIKYLSFIPKLFIYGKDHTNKVNSIINKTIKLLNQNKVPFSPNMTGLTNRKYLEEVVRLNGQLPYPNIPHNRQNGLNIKNPLHLIKFGMNYITWYTSAFVLGEIEFTRIYYDLGYRIECYPHTPGLIYPYKNDTIR
tara:strand:- start:3725 stop:4627 length:903 start_codon:yes stop_codon:yes gene_type:complete